MSKFKINSTTGANNVFGDYNTITNNLGKNTSMDYKASINGDNNIVIQDIAGATITINPANPDEIRKLIMDLGAKLSSLPNDVVKLIEEKQDLNSMSTSGANLYITVLYDTRNVLKWGLLLTNLTKENRYFNQPFFKIYPKFSLLTGAEVDTFQMIHDANINFAYKLEYGQPLQVTFEIKIESLTMYSQLLEKDNNAYIQAFIGTTVGELYESNKYPIKDFLSHFHSLNK